MKPYTGGGHGGTFSQPVEKRLAAGTGTDAHRITHQEGNEDG
ncbi:MAG TPA: hypothetical protein PLE36_13785 [Deltaproteobacteria bacterium]|nr:hypothetical protein [Deltaproteobacteria bacterium]HPV28761.1 hypothetical protein [Deltaproteobacteria bacterium]HPX51611.1 hypothetical protein [Deltaproteobacteria bacterium]HQM21691.1 hypothetical protein [Deltaproteobacteria bacterium]